MWPSEESGFEPSAYSPAGAASAEAQIVENLQQDPIGVWRAIRRSWGARIVAGGIVVMAVIAVLTAVLHL
jgi:hypothetical protein